MQLEGLRQQLTAAGRGSSFLSPDWQLLPAAAAHCAAIDNVIKDLPNSASYLAARDALLSKFWSTFDCPIQQLSTHSQLFHLQNGIRINALESWISQELHKTANILQHDLTRLGYKVELHQQPTSAFGNNAAYAPKDVISISITFYSTIQQR